MSTLFCSEYGTLGFPGGWFAQCPAGIPLAEQHVTISGSSAALNPTGATTKLVQLNTDVACCLAFALGATPTAVVTAHRMAANETRMYVLPPNTTIAVIAATD